MTPAFYCLALFGAFLIGLGAGVWLAWKPYRAWALDFQAATLRERQHTTLAGGMTYTELAARFGQ
jgi:hypothetical protein